MTYFVKSSRKAYADGETVACVTSGRKAGVGSRLRLFLSLIERIAVTRMMQRWRTRGVPMKHLSRAIRDVIDRERKRLIPSPAEKAERSQYADQHQP